MVGELSLSKISLDDFEEWLTRNSWNMHKNPKADDETQRLVGLVELCLAESEAKPPREIIEKLESIAGFFVIGERPAVLTAACVQTVSFSSQFEPLAGVDKQPEMVFG
jgi:hypothetical protein